EHNAVREAVEAFSGAGSPPVLVYDLGDSRSAVLLRAVNARRAMVGVIMLVMDARIVRQDTSSSLKVMTPKLQRALADFASMRPDSAAPPARPPAPRPMAATPPPPTAPRSWAAAPPHPAAPRSLAAASPQPTAPRSLAATSPQPTAPRTMAATPPQPTAPRSMAATPPQPTAPRSMVATPPQPTAPRSLAAASPASGGAAATAGHRPQAGVTPEIDRLHAALRRSPIALHVQRLVPLTKGSQLKRYEVLLRPKSEDAPNAAPQAMLKAAVDNGLGSMIDRRVVTELIGHLIRHPEVWKSTAVMFSVNFTTTPLPD